MSQFYQNMQSTAAGLLSRFGAPVTIRRTIPGQYNPATGERTGDDLVEWRPMAVKTGIKQDTFSGFGSFGAMTGGTRIENGDMQLLVDCKGYQHIPAVGDSVIFANGEKWAVMQGTPVDPAGVTVLYKAIIRKG